MCYCEEISYQTFFIGIVFIIIILIRNNIYDKWFALFISSYVFVQLGEGLIWRSYKDNNNYLKYIGVNIVLYSILFQPVFNLIGAYQFTQYKFLYFILILFGLFSFFMIDIKEATNKLSVGINNHLSWNVEFNNKIFSYIWGLFYIVFLLYPFVNIREFNIKILLLTYGIITLLYSFYNYNKSYEFTSYWCYLATGFTFLYYFITN